MRKGYLCLLAVAMVIASIMIAGCTTSNQANQASSSETSNATTTAAAKTTNSSVASASPTVTPSPSASPTVATPTPSVATPTPSVATPTPSVATPTPSVSQKIATSIRFASDPSGSKGQSLNINVISSASGLRICAPGLVTATKGTVTSGGSDCFYTAYLDTSGLNSGDHVTLKFAGDNTYQPSQTTVTIP
jgi:hypothetical protein